MESLKIKSSSLKVSFKNDLLLEPPLKINKVGEIKPPDNFPNCHEECKKIHKQFEDWFKGFPQNCCDRHKALLTREYFDKTEFSYAPDLLNRNIWFYRNIVNKYKDQKKYFYPIIDFVEVARLSFGQHLIPEMNFLQEKFIDYVVLTLDEKIFKLKEKRRKKLLEYFQKNYQSSHDSFEYDIKQLEHTYNAWIDALPLKHPFLREKI